MSEQYFRNSAIPSSRNEEFFSLIPLFILISLCFVVCFSLLCVCASSRMFAYDYLCLLCVCLCLSVYTLGVLLCLIMYIKEYTIHIETSNYVHTYFQRLSFCRQLSLINHK